MSCSVSYNSAQASQFSPFTVFESTISNASMLIESMSVRDLLLAFRVVSQLSNQLIEVLDPRVVGLTDAVSQQQQQQQQHLGNASKSSCDDSSISGGGLDSGAIMGIKMESSNLGQQHQHHQQQHQVERIASKSSSAAFHSQQQHQQQQQQHQRGSSSGCLSDHGSGSSGDLSTECKALLRRAFRTLKDELGNDLFDYTLPFSARVNLGAADRVIDRARQLVGHLPCHPDDWNRAAQQYMRVWYSCYLKPNMKRTNREIQFANLIQRASTGSSSNTAQPPKLHRRIRGFELMRPTLDSVTASRYAAALTVDFTSSDESAADEDGSSSAVGADEDFQLPRPLAWESAELRGLKEQLDAMYADNFAEPEERRRLAAQLLARRRRHLAPPSSRPPPIGCPDWALSANSTSLMNSSSEMAAASGTAAETAASAMRSMD